MIAVATSLSILLALYWHTRLHTVLPMSARSILVLVLHLLPPKESGKG